MDGNTSYKARTAWIREWGGGGGVWLKFTTNITSLNIKIFTTEMQGWIASKMKYVQPYKR